MWEFKNISFLSGTEIARHKQQSFKVSNCSAESFESALQGSEAFGLEHKWRLLRSAPWAGWGLRSPWGQGRDGPCGRLGMDLAHSCGIQCQVTACLEGDQGHTSERIRARQGHAPMRAGRDEGKTLPFQRHSLRKLKRFPRELREIP